jgi:hypothetical protein
MFYSQDKQDVVLEQRIFKGYKNGVFVDVIGFENNYHDTSVPIIHFLSNHNFKIFHSSLDIFMINTNSIFMENLL